MSRGGSNPEYEASRILEQLAPEVKDFLLSKLIKERIQDQQRGFIPDPAWLTVQRTFRLPYAEVFVVRRNPDSAELEGALTYRSDRYWRGWHIPGGRIADPTLSFEEACQLVARAELGITNLRLLNPDPVLAFLWQDHPYGHPISLLGVGATDQKIPRKVARFFPKSPQNMVAHHAGFFQRGLAFVAQNSSLQVD